MSGSRVLRVLLIVVALAAAVVLLFTIVFPWFDRNFVNDPTLGTLGTLGMSSTPLSVEADADR